MEIIVCNGLEWDGKEQGLLDGEVLALLKMKFEMSFLFLLSYLCVGTTLAGSTCSERGIMLLALMYGY